MIGVNVSSDVKITSGEIREAWRERMMDAATKGFAVSQERVPEDRGTLRQSGFQPEWRGNRLVYGYTAPQAEPMEEGTGPFYPPLEPLQEWAERIGKGRGFGYWVARHKIPEEGIDAQPYLSPSAESARSFLRTHSLEDYL